MNEQNLLQHIKHLIAAQLVDEESEDRFAFHHELTRQAAYSSLLRRERKTLHAQVGAAMERLYADALDTHVAELAYHFFKADAWEKAFEYSARAGKAAQALYAPRAAIDYFTQALEAARQLQRPAPIDLLRARGKAHETIGAFEPARSDLEAALNATRASGERRAEWETLLDLGLLWTSRDYAKTGEYLTQALDFARTLDDATTLGHSLNRLGNYLTNIERPQEAISHHQEALDIFRKLNDAHGLAGTFDLMATTLIAAGDWVQGRAYQNEAARQFQALDDRQGLVSSLAMSTFRGGTYLNDALVPAESLSESARHGEKALQIARQIDQRPAEALACHVLAFNFGAQGDYARALALAQEGLSIAEAIEHHHWMTFGNLILGALHLDLLADAKAHDYLERALASAQEIRSQFFFNMGASFLIATHTLQGDFERADALFRAAIPPGTFAESNMQRQIWCARGEMRLAQGQPDEALRIAERLIHSAPSIEQADEHAIPRLGLLRGAALSALSRVEEAERVLLAARDTAQTQHKSPVLWRIQIGIGKHYLTADDRERAREAFDMAHRLIEQLAANIPSESLRENFLQQALAQMPVRPSLTPPYRQDR